MSSRDISIIRKSKVYFNKQLSNRMAYSETTVLLGGLAHVPILIAVATTLDKRTAPLYNAQEAARAQAKAEADAKAAAEAKAAAAANSAQQESQDDIKTE